MGGQLNAGCFSSEYDDWNTPDCVLERVRSFAPIGLDPCSNAQSIVDAAVTWRLDQGTDALGRTWRGHGLVFVNPPYGDDIAAFARKMAREAAEGVEIIALLPHRTDTAWWQIVAATCTAKCEWHGRLQHGHGVADNRQVALFPSAPPPPPPKPTGTAPFPSVVAYWGQYAARFAACFKDVGQLWVPIR